MKWCSKTALIAVGLTLYPLISYAVTADLYWLGGTSSTGAPIWIPVSNDNPLPTTGGGGGLTFTDGTHTVTGSTQLTVTGGTIGGTTPNATLTISASATSFTPGTTTILGATAPCFLVNSTGTTSACDALGANVATALGLTLNGSGAMAATTSPTFVTPVLGAATATSLNGLTITSTTGTFTLAAAKTLTVSNTLTIAGTDGSTLNVGAGGTLGALAFITPGTGIATALGVNIGSAGAPVVLGGAGGTPSSIVLTNGTGTAAGLTVGAATLANGLKSATTTVVVSAATAPTAGQVLTATSGTAADWETLSASATSITPGTTTIVGATSPCAIVNTTSTVMGCLAYGATGNSTLVETTAGGLLNPAILPLATNAAIGGSRGDGTSITCVAGVCSATGQATLAGTSQVLTGGFAPTAVAIGTVTSGTTTIDCGSGPLQLMTNGGASTLAMTTGHLGNCTLHVINNGSAGAITFSGFSEGSNTGDALDTTNAHEFDIVLTKIGTKTHYLVSAYQ